MVVENKKAEILHICADYPYNKLYDLLISNLSEGNPNRVYVPSYQKENHASYPVTYLGRDFSKIDRLLYYRKQRIILKDIERRGLCENAGIIHAHTLFTSGYVAWKLSKKYNIPFIVAVRNADVNVFFQYMLHLRSIGINILLDAQEVVFISPVYKKYVLEKLVPTKYRGQIEEKSRVIPNGINDFFLENEYRRPNRNSSDRHIKLLYVGEVNANKNVLTTLKTCEILENKGYEPTLTIVGRISDSTLECVRDNRYVTYYPQSSKEEIINHYRHNDIFVMPSINETFGLVYIESLSQGMPIIYSKGQGVDGYFEEGKVGYHVVSTDALDVAQAIERILDDYNAISSRCHDAASTFSWRRIASIYNTIYKRLLVES